MKWIALLLLVMSCSTYKIPKTIEDIPVGEVIEVTKPIEVVETPVEEHIVKVNVKSLTGFTASQEARFRKIAANVQAVINSKEFKEMVLNFEYNGKKQFISTTDSNEQVLQKILSKDWELIYKLEYRIWGSTIGYTLASVEWIVIYTKFWNSLDDAEIACNMIHEYGGHKLGRYDHDMNWNKARDYSTPYGLGYGGEKIYRKMFMTE